MRISLEEIRTPPAITLWIRAAIDPMRRTLGPIVRVSRQWYVEAPSPSWYSYKTETDTGVMIQKIEYRR